jgi:hypothetical protein
MMENMRRTLNTYNCCHFDQQNIESSRLRRKEGEAKEMG